ncbi:MAG TPA: hypothetical protein VHI71_06990 [Actinomycetota bacterium]|nr:hypothetical protein [Actinomycetota bacterium]
MILGRKKTIAGVAAAAIMASGAMWAPSASAAPTCVDVPGSTLGATVKVGPVEQRIPAVANVRLCAEGATAPVFRTEGAAGGCQSNCFSVYVGGGAVDVGSLAVSWTEDGVAKSAAFNPDAVPLPGEECVISVGIPAAPNPACFIAIGVDDPSDHTDLVTDAVDDGRRTVTGAVTTAVDITCRSIPDRYRPGYGWVDFCTDPDGWVSAVGEEGVRVACGAFPVLYDDWGNSYEFCANPVGWTIELVNDVGETCNWTMGPQWDPNSWQYVYFCDDPVRWTELALENWCGSLCDPQTLFELIQTIRQKINEDIEIHIG